MTDKITPEAVRRRLLQMERAPSVHVLRAPPGDGKTEAVIQALIALHGTPGFTRVLYATHATVKDNAVGREIQDRFRALSGTAPVILQGRNQCSTQQAYDAQFSQPWVAGIKIIAHAHLATVLGGKQSQAAQFLRQAELLVIDEDPLTSLMVQSSEDFGEVLQCKALSRLPAPDPLVKALLGVWTEITAGQSVPGIEDWNSWGDPKGRPDRHSLTGEGFWTALVGRMGAPDWAALSDTLSGINARLKAKSRDERLPVRLLVDTLQEDVDASRLGNFSHRFGLYWAEDPVKVAFRFDLRVPLDLPCPVLVLDAYAEPHLYEALFEGHQVKWIREFDRPLSLEIEVVDQPLTPRDFANPAKLRNQRPQVARLVADMLERSAQDALLLAPATFFDADGPWMKTLNLLLKAYDVPGRADSMHWWAGRGKNAWCGQHVVALSPPHRPRTFRDHDLAALFPYDAQARHTAARHIEQAELLQMLHRGRQPHFDPMHRPRVVTFFQPELPAGSWVSVTPMSSVTFEKGMQLTGWKDAVRAVSEELLQEFGCVPVVALEVLGLVRVRSVKLERQVQLTHNLRHAIRPSAGAELRHWKKTGCLKKFRVGKYTDPDYIGVRCFGGNERKPLYDLLEGMGLRRADAFRVALKGGFVESGVIFASEEITQSEVESAVRPLLAGKTPRQKQGSAATWQNTGEKQQEYV